MEVDDDQKTIWCGNLSEKVTEEVLYELFLQAGPVRRVKIPKDKDGKQMSYGFVTFKHIESVPYAISLIEGISLFDRRLNLKPRQRLDQSRERPVSSSPVHHNHVNVGDLRGYLVNNIRAQNQGNYEYNENYGGNNRHQMRHDRRGNKGYHSPGARYNNHNNKPYNQHKNDRNRRNRR